MVFSDLIPIVVALVTILPTLITVLNAILQNSGHQRLNLINLTNIKTIQVKYVPLSQNSFKKLRNNYLLGLILFIVLIAIASIYFIYIYYRLGFYYLYYETNWTILTLDYLMMIVFIIYLNHKVISMGENPNDARFLIFEKLIVEIEADIIELFEYLIYVLVFMKANRIEFNQQNKTIKAVMRFGLYFFIIDLTLLKGTKENVHLTVDCERIFHYPSKINKWIDKLMSLSYTDKPEMKSAIMNNIVKTAFLDPKKVLDPTFTNNIHLSKKRNFLDRLLKKD